MITTTDLSWDKEHAKLLIFWQLFMGFYMNNMELDKSLTNFVSEGYVPELGGKVHSQKMIDVKVRPNKEAERHLHSFASARLLLILGFQFRNCQCTCFYFLSARPNQVSF